MWQRLYAGRWVCIPMYTVVGFFWTRGRGLGVQCLQRPFKLSDVIIEAPAWPTPSVPEVEMGGT